MPNHELCNNILDSVIEMNEDLTDLKDLKGNMDFVHCLYTVLLVKRPEYFQTYFQKSREPIGFDVKKAVQGIFTLTRLVEKDMKKW